MAQHGEVVVSDAYGPQRPAQPGETNPPMVDDDTMYRLYSMTKPIVAACAMVLVDEGRMALDDPLSKFIPAFGGTQRLWQGSTVKTAPTVRHLLQHRAGIHCPDFGELFYSGTRVLVGLYMEGAARGE